MAPPASPWSDLSLSLGEEDIDALYEPFDPLQADPVDLPMLPSTGQPGDPIDWGYLHSLLEEVYEDIADHYFRAELIGTEKLMDEGPLIVAPNHSGTAFPHDGVILDLMLWRHDGYRRDRKFRSVFSPKLAATWWMRLYTLDNWWRRCGGVDMTFGNYDQLLERGERVIYYPEGVPGIGKGFTKRYQLQHFHSSFIVLAAKHDAPVYPVSVVNAEWVNPTSFTFDAIDRLGDRLLGLPFFPLPIALLALIFPFIFYFAFPSRMVFEIGDPIDVRALLRSEGCDDLNNPKRAELMRAAERIRQTSQRNLDAAVHRHGDKPWDLKGLWRSLKQAKGRRSRILPTGWPFTVVRHDRDRQRPPAKSTLHAVLRDLDIGAFYLPFGWFILALSRELREPPYGYRGLSAEERMVREGTYRWSLASNPLPSRASLEDAARREEPNAKS